MSYQSKRTAKPVRAVGPSSVASEIMIASSSGQLSDELMYHMVEQRMKDKVLKLRSGSHGKPQLFAHIPVPNVSSSHASARTIQQRQGERREQMVCGSAD